MSTFVAVDAQNLYYSARKAGGKVDFQLLWNRIQELEPDSQTIVYVIRSDTFNSSGFEGLLRDVGYKVSHRQSESVFDNGRVKLKYDDQSIRISLDAAVKYIEKYEKFVLVTGDADYSDLFALLKSRSKATEIWSFHRALCQDMLWHVDKIEFLGPEMLKDAS